MTTQIGKPISELSIIDETAIDTGDPIFTTKEVQEMSYQMLRKLSANANSELINGKSPRLAMHAFFGCQRTLDEYTDD